MLDTFLQPSAVTRLIHLLQAAQPFLTPSWNRLADMCIRLLNISELLFHPHASDFSRLLRDVRGCTPSNDMSALLCAIQPFCSDEELQMLQMYEQFRQMQKMMDMWKMFSDLMPDAGTASGAASPFDNLAGLFGVTAQPSKDAPFFSGPETDRPTTQAASLSEDSSGPQPELQPEAPNPLLSFLSPEQLALYNSILADTDDTSDTMVQP